MRSSARREMVEGSGLGDEEHCRRVAGGRWEQKVKTQIDCCCLRRYWDVVVDTQSCGAREWEAQRTLVTEGP